MEQNGINYEVKRKVLTFKLDLLFKGKEYTLTALDDYSGVVTFSLTGVVLGKEYTFSFIYNDVFVTHEVICDALSKFEQLYY